MVVDTSAIVAILLGEVGYERYVRALADAETCLMAAPTWLECAMVITTRLGQPGMDAMEQLLAGALVEVVPFDEELARAAHRAWIQFGKGRHPAALNFGDCISYALARQSKAPLLFKGLDFAQTDALAAVPAMV